MKRFFLLISIILFAAFSYAQDHFVPAFTGSGQNHMNIYIMSAKIGGIELEAGDEIAAYDDVICCGIAKLTQTIVAADFNTFAPIAASQKESGLPNGYTSGHTITYKLWDKSNCKEISGITANYFDMVTGLPTTAPTYLPDETVIVALSVAAPANLAPVSNAGIDQSIIEFSEVTLDGTASSDPDCSDVLTYLWTAPNGITLSSTTASKPTFTAPDVNTSTPYTFTLVVNDGHISSSSDQVVITVQNCTPTAPTVGTITQPTCSLATGSVILNGLPATGTWSLIRSPGGTTTTGTGTSSTISSLAAGTYTYTVTNASSCVSLASANVVINAQPATPTAPTVGTITHPTCALATGSVLLSGLPAAGTWTLTRSPGGTTSTGTGTSSTVSALAAGTYTYTVTNASGCISTASANVVINDQPATPTAPTVGTITQPTCALATGTVTLNDLPASGTWTLTRSPGGTITTGTGTSSIISSLAVGTYTYTVTNAVGCISVASANVVITAPPSAPTAPTFGTITQPTCALATGGVILNGLPATGTWTLTRSPGGTTSTGSGISSTISSLVAGTYTYTVTNSLGCISAASANLVINDQPLTPTAPTVGTITHPTCALSTGSVLLSGLPAAGTWTLTRTPGGTTTTGTGTSSTVSTLGAGTYTYTVTNASGCISSASANVVVNDQPATPTAPTVGTITQPTCALSTGGVILNGLPATGTWTLTKTPGGTTSTGTGTSSTISSLVAGTYTYTVTNASGCVSAASANVVINDQPITPTAPIVGTITHPTCALATGSVLLSGLPATGSWILTRTPGGTTTTGSGTSSTVSSVSAGTYTYTVTNASGCISSSSANVVINDQPATPTAPTVGTITQPTCALATGTVTLNGLPAAGTWTLTRTPGGTITTGTGTSSIISLLAVGSYTYTVTNAVGCISVASANVVITSPPSAPTAPTFGTITQPTCALATGGVILNGLPATGTWTLTRSPGGTTSTGTGISSTISSLGAGTYTYTVTNSLGCISSASANLVINDQPVTPTAPVVGTITHPTCALATGSVLLSGLPAAGSWTLTRTPGGTTTTGTGTSSTVSTLGAGTYTYTVTNASGCVSSASANVVVNDQPATPTAPTVGTITQPTCSLATGSVTLNDLPAAGTWTLTRTPGGTTSTGTGTSSTVSSLAAGTYTYTVTNASGCISLASGNVVINAQPVTPTAPTVGTITHPTCALSSGSVILSGLPAAGTWTLTRTPGGTTTTGTGTSSTVSSVTAGTYTYTVTNASGCISTASANVVINDQPATPTAPTVGTIIQPNCASPKGSLELTGLPATGTWTLTQTPAGTTSTGSGTSSIISSLTSGTYTYTVTNASGCISSASANVIITAPPSTVPIVGQITQPTCTLATGSVILSGLPATGTWTLTRTPGGTTTTGSGTSTTVSLLASGTYTYTVTNESGCISSESANVVVNDQPAIPTAPTVGTITQPTCALTTGSAVLNGLPASGTWTLTRSPGGTTVTGTGTSSTISSLAAETYTYTVTNASGCISSASANVVINNQPATTNAPTVGTITQPTCALSTGSVVLNGLPATGTWTLTRTPGGISTSGTGSNTTISSLAAGTYTYTVSGTSECISSASANVVINNQPATPAAPSVGTITQPTCGLSTGSAVLSGLPATGTWTLTETRGGSTYAGTGTAYTLTGLSTGIYTFILTNASGCISSESASVVINDQPATPSAPTVGTITQPTCALATASVVLSGLPASGTWTLTRIPGAAISTGTGNTYTISGLSSGTYTFTVKNGSDCTSSESTNVVINYLQEAPVAPLVGQITQAANALDKASVVLSSLPAVGNWILNPGNISGTGTSYIVSDLSKGTYNYTVTSSSGCISGQSADIVINIQALANAGLDQSVNEGTLANLDGSLSSDPDGDTFTYNWTAPEGITLSSKTAAKPTFTTPLVTVNTEYTFKLVVNDGHINSEENLVLITVANVDHAPYVSNSIENISVDKRSPDQIIDLNSVFSDDEAGDVLTFSVTSNSNIQVVQTVITGSNLNLSFSKENIGQSEIIIAASSNGQIISTNFKVEVNIPVGIVQLLDDAEVQIYPNPTKGDIQLKFNQIPNAGTWITVYSISGNVIKKFAGSRKDELINLKGNPAGIYFIKIDQKTPKTYKVVLQ